MMSGILATTRRAPIVGSMRSCYSEMQPKQGLNIHQVIFQNPIRMRRLRMSACYASLTSTIKNILEDAGTSTSVMMRCYEALAKSGEEQAQFVMEQAQKVGYLSDKLVKAQEERERKVEDLSDKLAKAQEEREHANVSLERVKLAEEVAKSRTMDRMRDLGMMHARGILEIAELYETPLQNIKPSKDPKDVEVKRYRLWKAILETRPNLAMCLEEAGYKVSEAARQIDSIYRTLNSKMHNNSGPESSESLGGINLYRSGDMTDNQVNILACICKEYYIRYNIVSAAFNIVDEYPGISDPLVRTQWENSVQRRKKQIAAKPKFSKPI